MVRINTLNDVYSNTFIEILEKETVLGFTYITYSLYGNIFHAIFNSVGRKIKK